MFNNQVKLLDGLLAYKIHPGAIEVLKQMFGQCGQELEHRGTIKVTEPIQGAVFWAKARSDWVNVARNGSYVDCYRCTTKDGSGVDVSKPVRVYLPRQSSVATTTVQGLDPNVRSGAVIGYLLDPNAVAVCVTGHLDDKLGTVKQWAGTIAEIPPGWEILTAIKLGGGSPWNTGVSIYASCGHVRVPLPYYAGDPDFDQIGKTGGACTHTHADHTIGNYGPQSHVVTVGSTAVTVTIGLERLTWTGYTYCATTGITIDDHPDHTHYLTYTSQSVTTGQGYTETVDCIDLCTSIQASTGCSGYIDLTHTLNEPVCYDGYGHRHYVDIDLGYHNHTATSPAHTHSISIDDHPAHTHSIDSHSTEEHLDPYIVISWIIRTS